MALAISAATASRKSAFLSKQSYVDNQRVVSDKLGRRDGGGPRIVRDEGATPNLGFLLA